MSIPRLFRRLRWVTLGASLTAVLGLGGVSLVAASPPDADPVVVTIVPCRHTDTRPGPNQKGPKSSPFGPNETVSFDVHGTNGDCTIPSTAVGILANVTSVNPTADGYVTIFPAGSTAPLSSNLNPIDGQGPTPNQVTVDIGTGGQISVYNRNGQVDLIIDIVAYTVDHDHDADYAAAGHDHDADYAAAGHDHDAEYLNTAGDTATGTITAPGFALSSPSERRYVVTEADLVPRQATATIVRHAGQGGAYVTSAPTDDMMAGVHLPDGARITQLVMRSFDGTSVGGENITTVLLRHKPSGGFYVTVGTVATFAAGDRVVDSTTVSHVVDNSDGAYVIRVSGANASNLRFMSLEIVYEVSSL